MHWWASSSDTLIYPSIFAFPLLPLHHQSTSMHPCTDATTHSLIWWTHVLWFTCFISILSIPNMRPPMVWPIMSPGTPWSGTFYSFTLDEPYAPFLVDHSYLTCLYLPFDTHNFNHMSFPQNSNLAVTPHITLCSPHTISHCITLPWNPTIFTLLHDPLPPDHTLRAP